MSSLTLEILPIEKQNEWDSILLKSEQATIFNTFAWANIIKNTFDLKGQLYCVFRDFKMVGGILLFYRSKYRMKIITPVPLTLYNGILYFFENEQKAQKENQYLNDITEIIINQVKKDFKYCNFSLHPSIADIRTFKWNDWLIEPCYTYIVPLKDEKEIRENFSSSLRRKISRAEEQNLQLTEDENIESLITLQEESYRKNGLKPILDKSTFIRFCNYAKDAGLLKVFSIYGNEGKIYSSRAILLWNNVVYDWIAGTSTEFQHTNSTHLLVWEILKKYSKEEYKSFDFMGANTRRIIDFKKSFGGKLTTYYDVKYYSSSFVKLLFRINEMVLKKKRIL